VEAAAEDRLAPAIASAAQQGARGMITIRDPVFVANRAKLAALAAAHRLPAAFDEREYADAGGLLSYGANLAHVYARAAVYVDKILKGAKPAELPVEQPTKFELVVNLKTAKALGIAVPPALLARADEVIE
jgi:putative ABC transport system substrate-binding protein